MAGGARAAQWALGVGIWVWLAALLLAPVALRPFCAFICHQRPERSFVVAGVQMPVCARCTGLYAGAALAVPAALLFARTMPSHRARLIIAVAAVPTAATWILEAAGLVAFSNAARFSAALPLGFAAAWLVLAVVGDRDHRLTRSSV